MSEGRNGSAHAGGYMTDPFVEAKWIAPSMEPGDAVIEFEKQFPVKGNVLRGTLVISAAGAYVAELNGSRVGDFVLAPGCTAYDRRLQYQEYDITDLLKNHNRLLVSVGKGWLRSRLTWKRPELNGMPCALIAAVYIRYSSGDSDCCVTDESWTSGLSDTVFNDLWDGETYDATLNSRPKEPVILPELTKEVLIPQEGPFVREQETFFPKRLITTPRGERVIDFGQEIAGYVAVRADASSGDRISLSCGEMLDRDGNFYNANYRSAKSRYTVICREGEAWYKPRFTFYGFRYIRVDEYPGEVDLKNFRAIALYSDMEQTGFIRTSDEKLNRLFQNVLWSQRGNFVDIPTDCPQRDERMGWTGDAQVFARAACYNYDTRRFFSKWLGDVRADQRPDGSVPDTVPNFWNIQRSSAGWGDVMTVLPWQLYQMYGDARILEKNFEAMKRWVDYITGDTLTPGLWTAPDDSDLKWQKHYGDWLALDAEEGSYRGATPNDLIASAFYAHSTDLLVRAGRAIGKDMAEYEALYQTISAAFRTRFSRLTTQTEHVLALAFRLTDDEEGTAASLARMIRENGNKLKTGFIGTPYLLHALSDHGYAELAYDLLLQEEYPSWLYEVNHGATTIWEHWDGQKEDGSFWSTDMNSFNHYAYGSVIDWVYSVAGGIRPDPDFPGFQRAVIAPVPSSRLGSLEVEYHSVRGKIVSEWFRSGSGITYRIITPVPARIMIRGEIHEVNPGSYQFYSD